MPSVSDRMRQGECGVGRPRAPAPSSRASHQHSFHRCCCPNSTKPHSPFSHTPSHPHTTLSLAVHTHAHNYIRHTPQHRAHQRHTIAPPTAPADKLSKRKHSSEDSSPNKKSMTVSAPFPSLSRRAEVGCAGLCISKPLHARVATMEHHAVPLTISSTPQ